jgi:hypothetical protein
LLTSTTEWKELTAIEKKHRLLKAYVKNVDRWERYFNERYRESNGY